MPRDPVHKIRPGEQDAPSFDTERFVVVPLAPPALRQLTKVLLGDARLADQLPWLQDKSADGIEREAFLLELQCAARATRGWGIVERARVMFIGAVLARQSLEGIDLEVLCASQFWNQGVADEVCEPVAEWLEQTTDVLIGAPLLPS